MAKSYLLLFDKSDGTILIPVKVDTAAFAPGAPALFGGTRDGDASGNEKTAETLRRELKEESGQTIQLDKEAKFLLFFSAEGGQANFYWTSDFNENIRAFKANSEMKDILSLDALSLKQKAASPKILRDHLLFLVGTPPGRGTEDFRKSYTSQAIYHWITKVYQPTNIDLMQTVPPYSWTDYGNVY